jgi:hypothetical protein
LEERLRRLGEAVDEWRCTSTGVRQQLDLEADTKSGRNTGQETANLSLQATQEMGRLLDGIRLQPWDPRRWRVEELLGPRRVEEVRILTNKVKQAMKQMNPGRRP